MINSPSSIKQSLLVVATLVLLIVSCSGDSNTVRPGVVATVGSFEISDKHFENHLRRFYLRTGQAANLNEDFRLAVINARIERYSIVEHARDMGWASDADAVYNQAMIERKVYMEEYQRRFIYDRIQLSEQAVREVFRRSNSSVRASHLLAQTPQEAENLYNRLQAGESFESLAREVFQNPALRTSGGDLGFISMDEMDLAFEDAAFSMQPGEISRPVRTTTGYSIIKVTEVVEAPILTEFQFAQQRRNLEQVARYQEQERATRHDLSQVLEQLQWNTAEVDRLWDMIQSDRNAYVTSDVSLSELPVQVDETTRERVLAGYRGFQFTINDFLIESYYTPAERRAQMRSKEDFLAQLEGMAYRNYALGLVRNHPGLDMDFINESINETFYGYLFERFENDLDTKISVSDAAIRAKFNEDPSIFVQPVMLDMSEIALTDAELAGEVYTRLKSGASFQQMLRQYGADTATKQNDGHIGNLPITQFGSMASALGSIRPGEVAGPFQVATNYYIILKCNARTESRPLSFEEAEPKVREFMFSNERQRVRDGLIQDLRSRYNARIDMNRLNTISFQL